MTVRLHKQLRRPICIGDWRRAYTPLVLRQLTRQFNVGQIAVIEAIHRLEHAGLVRMVPNWGAVIFAFGVNTGEDGGLSNASTEGSQL